MTGKPLNLAMRIQYNLDVEPIENLEVMKNLTKLIMPLFWVEEQLSANETFTNEIKQKLYL